MKLRILLADDHKILRQALRSVLEQEPDIEVIAEAEDGVEAIALARTHGPDVVVMDIGMPRMDGIEATRRMLAECPEIRVVALSTYSDRRIAQQMIEAGAKGYVIKAAGGDELLSAIRAVGKNDSYFSPAIDARSGSAEGPSPTGSSVPGDGPDRRLGKREREVLQLLCDGLDSADIGARLGIAASTVDVHRLSILRKFDLRNQVELDNYLRLHGLD